MSQSSRKSESAERRLRRSYSILVFGGPWLLSLSGLALIAYALLAHRPTSIQIASLSSGVVMTVVGLMSLRISGPVEVTPKGIKGSLDAIPPETLFVARHAATHAVEESNSSSEAAGNAAFKAIEDFAVAQSLARQIGKGEKEQRLLFLLFTQDTKFSRYAMQLISEEASEQLVQARRRGDLPIEEIQLGDDALGDLRELMASSEDASPDAPADSQQRPPVKSVEGRHARKFPRRSPKRPTRRTTKIPEPSGPPEDEWATVQDGGYDWDDRVDPLATPEVDAWASEETEAEEETKGREPRPPLFEQLRNAYLHRPDENT
jgi:hypothetical protein